MAAGANEPFEYIFESLESKGSAHVGGPARLPLLGLKVDGAGRITFSLSEAQAEALMKAGKQAAHGKGMQDVVDKKARDTIQIEPDCLTLDNPAWGCALQALAEDAAEGGLGLPASDVGRSLRKLSLYGPGGHFARHRDAEKVEGMLGALFIQLPSFFEGGEVVACHSGQEKARALGASDGSAQLKAYHCALYADCEHEARAAPKAHCLALAHALQWGGNGPAPGSGAQSSSAAKIAHCLRARAESGEHSLTAQLEHQRASSSLGARGLATLKGKDAIIAKALAAAQEMLAGDKVIGSLKKAIASFERGDSERGARDRHCFYLESSEEGDGEARCALDEAGDDIVERAQNFLNVTRPAQMANGSEKGWKSKGRELECADIPAAQYGVTCGCHALAIWDEGKELEMISKLNPEAAAEKARRGAAEARAERASRILSRIGCSPCAAGLLSIHCSEKSHEAAGELLKELSAGSGLKRKCQDRILDAARFCGWDFVGSCVMELMTKSRAKELSKMLLRDARQREHFEASRCLPSLPRRAELIEKLRECAPKQIISEFLSSEAQLVMKAMEKSQSLPWKMLSWGCDKTEIKWRMALSVLLKAASAAVIA